MAETPTTTHWDKFAKAAMLLAISGSLLMFIGFLTQLKEYKYVGRNNEVTQISVSGEGEAFAKPDVAEVSFSINEKGKTVAEAQEKVNAKMKKIMEFLATSGVEEKDIKNTYYNFNPTYEWQRTASAPVVCTAYGCPSPEGKQVQTGFEVTQSIDVKIRKIDDAGKIVGGLGEQGATNMSNINFTIDNEDGLKEEARKQAIEKAKAKAEKLAKDLGVDLVRITSFSEGGEYPVWNYARAGSVAPMALEAKAADQAVLPVGQNKIVSNVTITYEIR